MRSKNKQNQNDNTATMDRRGFLKLSGGAALGAVLLFWMVRDARLMFAIAAGTGITFLALGAAGWILLRLLQGVGAAPLGAINVTLIGEIRDAETMKTALTAADTGHLVFSTLHTLDAAQTIHRILSFFPPHQHEEIRFLMSNTLKAIVSQRLIPTVNGDGRVAAAEVILAHDIGVMFATEAIPTQVTSYEVVERGAAVAAHEARIRGPQLQRADRVSETRAGHAQAFGLQQARSFAVGGHEGGIAGAVSYSRVQHARRRG